VSAPVAQHELLDSYEAYGCRINALDPEELFDRYAEAGFLYPAKRERIAPFLPQIVDNWRRALRAGELIHWVATSERPETGGWASISSWRSTHSGWNTQHLVSIGDPLGTRAVLLGGQAVRIRDGFDRSHQSWFRPDNRFPRRVFGTIDAGVGAEHATVIPQTLLAIEVAAAARLESDVRTSRQIERWQADLDGLAAAARGSVYVTGEELDCDDLELDAVDQLYRHVGLRRYRRIWLAWHRDDLLGAAIVWRGPLGFNFSFLENRCDLLLEPMVAPERAGAVVRALLCAAASSYEDFPLGQIPLAVRDGEVPHVVDAGAQFVREYTQSIWLQPGFEAMYAHMAHFYARIERAGARLGLGATTGEEGGARCIAAT
jgi:hypothetical protein